MARMEQACSAVHAARAADIKTHLWPAILHPTADDLAVPAQPNPLLTEGEWITGRR